MTIGTIIRTYRKEKHMTQKEMANRLGVTTPAVNKWENGNSYPDILLLAPIARLLEISTDTLLGYEENLTEQEINQIAQDVNEKIKNENYDTAFSFAMEKIKTYPNCETLIYNLAAILDAYLIFLPEEQQCKYKNSIHKLYHQLLNSNNADMVNAVLILLFSNALSNQQYEQAQKYLNRLPRQTPNPDQYQASLYEKQGDIEKAYALYEKLLLSNYFNLSWALLGLYRLAMKEHDLDRAEQLIEKHKELSRLLEMGPYQEVAPELDFFTAKKDVEGTLRVLETVIENIDNLDAFKNSVLYRHMDFSKNGTENLSFMLKKCFEDDSLTFLTEDKRYQELLAKLQKQ